jgi:hypothetical protein
MMCKYRHRADLAIVTRAAQTARRAKEPRAANGGLRARRGELPALSLARKIGCAKIYNNNTPTPFA